MSKNTVFYRSFTALLTVWAMVVSPILVVTVQTQPTPLKDNRQTTVQQAVGSNFPRTYKLASGSAIVYEPQIANWEDRKRAVAWAEVAYTPTSSKQAALGTIKIEAATNVALDERLVKLSPMKITEIKFPALSREDAQKFSTELQAAMPDDERTLALDRVLAAVDGVSRHRSSRL